MTEGLTFAQLRQLRLAHQGLTAADRFDSAAEVVRRLCALQSQEWPSAQLAIAARARGLSPADIQQAREIERSFVLTWSLRGTLHLAPAEDLGWQLALFGPRAIRGTRRRYQQLGLTESVRERALDAIAEVLTRSGPLTRAELAAELAVYDIPVAGQAIHHLVRFAALRGLICLGPERGGDLTYVLLNDWLPDFHVADDVETLPKLARRYLAAYGPASHDDFSRWTGMSARDVRSAFDAIATDTVEVETPDGAALMLREQLERVERRDAPSCARFLPRYDNYLLAYHSRDFMVAPAHAKRVHPGGGMIRACVLIDGWALANWKLEKRGARGRVVLEPFETLDAGQLALLEAETQALGAFFKTEIALRVQM